MSIKIPEFNTEKKEALIGIANNKKNSAAVGIVGKIRDAIENFFLDEEWRDAWALGSFGFGVGCRAVALTLTGDHYKDFDKQIPICRKYKMLTLVA